MRIVVLIPTRNRADLATRAVGSALAQPCRAPVEVVVSDNSDDPTQAQTLAAALRGRERIAYLRPPQPLSMGDHWDWALGEAQRRAGMTHLIVLTDRMVFRDAALDELAGIAQGAPAGHAVSFLHDRINDIATPVVLERHRWSGAVCTLASARLLELSSRGVFHESFPRLLNALVPKATLEAVRARFGDHCRAVSPDYCFAYRYMTLQPALAFFDKALMIHSAINRSNGASTTRGVLSGDAVSFRQASLAGGRTLPHAPYPELVTLGNSIIEEYRAALGQAGLPAPVEPRAYLKMLFNDIAALEDEATRAGLLALLRERGHGADVLRLQLRQRWKRATKGLERGAKRLLRPRSRQAPPALAFGSVDAALQYDREQPPPRSDSQEHLRALQPQA